MANFDRSGMTRAGINLMGKAVGGATIQFTRLVLGDGTMTGEILDLQGVVSPKQNVDVTRIERNDNQCTVGGELLTSSVKQGFFWRECGLYAMDPDLGEILYNYAYSAKPDYIAASDSGMMEEILVSMVATVGSNAKVDVTIDKSMVFMTQKDFIETKRFSSTSMYETTVFEKSRDFNANYFRIPFGTITPKGTLIAGADIRYNTKLDESLISLGVARSEDMGRTWQDKKVAIPNSGVSSVSRVMDGTILCTKKGTLYLLGNKYDRNTMNWTQVTQTPDPDWDSVLYKSEDDGVTWTYHKSLKNILPPGHIAFLGGVGNGIQMENGTLVFPVQVARGNDSPYNTVSTLIYSTDGGDNWTMPSGFVNAYTSECNIVEYETGKLLINARQEGSKLRVIYRTDDMGDTFLPFVSNLTLKQSNPCMGSMIKIKAQNGKDILLFSNPYNDYTDFTNGRGNICLQASFDNGRSFEVVGVIYAGLTDGYTNLIYDEKKNTLYILLEIDGNILFKNISSLLYNILSVNTYNVVEKGVYTRYVSAQGDDKNMGTESHPFRTLKCAMDNIKKWNNSHVRLVLVGHFDEDLELVDIDNFSKLTITSSTKSQIRNLIINNNKTPIFINGIVVNGKSDDTNGIVLENSTLFIDDTKFTNNSLRTVTVINCKFTTHQMEIHNTNAQGQCALCIERSTANVGDLKIQSESVLQNGIFIGKSNLTYTQLGGYKDKWNAEKEFNLFVCASMSSNVRYRLSAMNNWNVHGTYAGLSVLNNGTNISVLTGAISHGTTENNTVLFTLNGSLPLFEQVVTAVGWDSLGNTIPVAMILKTNGEALLSGANFSDLKTILLDGVTFVNNNYGNALTLDERLI